MKKTRNTLLAIGAVALTVSTLISSCTKENPDSPGFEYMPDMYRSPSVETNGVNSWNTKDSSMMGNMLPPDGTIPVGFTPFPYANNAQGDTLASKYWTNPLAHNDSIEDEGKFLYTRFCFYCHGTKGDGNGPLVESGKYGSTPPSYIDRYNAGWLTDGHVYHVITYGKGNMGSHSGQLSPEERWKVIEYVQRLGRGGDSWSAWKAKMAMQAAAADTIKDKKPATPAAGGTK